MDTLQTMLKNVIIFVLLAVPGFLMVKGKLLSGKDSGTLSKLLTYVGMPFMIMASTLDLKFTGSFTKSMLITAAIGAVFILAMYGITGLIVRSSDKKRRGMMRFCMIFANNGFIGIPLAKAVFPEGSDVIAFLIVLNILNNVLMFTLGAYLISGDKRTMNLKKAVLNPVLLGFLAGIALNLLGVGQKVPQILDYSKYFSGIVTPLSMLVLGIKLAEVPLRKLLFSGRMYYVSLVRLVLFPALCVVLMLGLQFISQLGVSDDMVMAFFIAFVMPTAGLASAFSDQYKGDTEGAVVFTLGTTVLSVAVIPALYWVVDLVLKNL